MDEHEDRLVANRIADLAALPLILHGREKSLVLIFRRDARELEHLARYRDKIGVEAHRNTSPEHVLQKKFESYRFLDPGIIVIPQLLHEPQPVFTFFQGD